MLDLLKFALVGGVLLAITFVVLLSLPSSRLREFLMPIIGWTFAAVCGIYVVCPLDFVPDVIPIVGWVDDAGALVAGIAAAATAMTAGKDRH